MGASETILAVMKAATNRGSPEERLEKVKALLAEPKPEPKKKKDKTEGTEDRGDTGRSYSRKTEDKG